MAKKTSGLTWPFWTFCDALLHVVEGRDLDLDAELVLELLDLLLVDVVGPVVETSGPDSSGVLGRDRVAVEREGDGSSSVAIGIVLSEEPNPPEVLGFEQAARIADRLGIAMAAPPARRRNCRRFMGWGVIVRASSRGYHLIRRSTPMKLGTTAGPVAQGTMKAPRTPICYGRSTMYTIERFWHDPEAAPEPAAVPCRPY